MNRAEQERSRIAFRKAFNRSNQRWEYNGRAFETRMELYRSNVWISAYLECRAEETTVRLHIGRAFKEMVDVDSPCKTFTGKDCLISALDYLSDSFTETIQKVQDLEREAIKQAVPQISAAVLEEIFGAPGRVTG